MERSIVLSFVFNLFLLNLIFPKKYILISNCVNINIYKGAFTQCRFIAFVKWLLQQSRHRLWMYGINLPCVNM